MIIKKKKTGKAIKGVLGNFLTKQEVDIEH